MARRGGSSSKRMRAASAKSYSFANPRLLRRFVPPRFVTAVEDRRTYHPLGVFRPAATLGDLRARTVVPRAARKASRFVVPSGLRFMVPERVAICARRKVRKEVMHALGRAGSGGMRKPRRKWFSAISCKR